MPTPSEQKALAFVAIVVLLGGAVRVVRAGATASATPLQQQALARQASAADSAAATPQPRRARGSGGRPRRAPGKPTVVGGVVGVPLGAPPDAVMGHDGFPPPSPRVDVDYRDNRPDRASAVSGIGSAAERSRQPPVDLDRASEHEIEALPRVGPATARRIVANRDSFGAFGSLEALGRVRGMGPATRKRLATLVTFSGRPSSRP